MIALNEAHVRRLAREYMAYYRADRTHDGLGKDTPRQEVGMTSRGALYRRVARNSVVWSLAPREEPCYVMDLENREANKLLTKEYRAAYPLPKV